MIKPAKLVLTAVIAACLLHLTGCQYRSSSDVYYLIAPNLQIPYWKAVQEGFKAAASEYHVTGTVAGPDGYDARAEGDALDTAVRRHPAGILISAADAALLRDGINSAMSAGVPVITVDSDDPLSNRLYFVGTNNLEAGHQGGKRLVQQLSGKGNVVIFTIANQPNLEERLQGYKDILVNSPAIKIVQVVSTGGDSGNAFDQMQQFLGRSGKDKIDAFVSLESTSGDAIGEVIQRTHATGRTVIAMDASPETLNFIGDGTIDSCISQKPWTMGYVGLKQLDVVHHRPAGTFKQSYTVDAQSPYPAFVDTGSTLITKSNLFLFQKAAGQ